MPQTWNFCKRKQPPGEKLRSKSRCKAVNSRSSRSSNLICLENARNLLQYRLDILCYRYNIYEMSVSHKRETPWLLLVFSLPLKQASQRVEVWRKLQRYGGLQLGSSGYRLPHTPANLEHFEWLATFIRKYKGQASVLEVQSIDDMPSEKLTKLFNEARSRASELLMRGLKKLGSKAGALTSRRLTRVRQRFQEIIAIDFFNCPL